MCTTLSWASHQHLSLFVSLKTFVSKSFKKRRLFQTFHGRVAGLYQTLGIARSASKRTIRLACDRWTFRFSLSFYIKKKNQSQILRRKKVNFKSFLQTKESKTYRESDRVSAGLFGLWALGLFGHAWEKRWTCSVSTKFGNSGRSFSVFNQGDWAPALRRVRFNFVHEAAAKTMG